MRSTFFLLGILTIPLVFADVWAQEAISFEGTISESSSEVNFTDDAAGSVHDKRKSTIICSTT